MRRRVRAVILGMSRYLFMGLLLLFVNKIKLYKMNAYTSNQWRHHIRLIFLASGALGHLHAGHVSVIDVGL